MRNVVLRVALLSFALLFVGSGPASAHASLVGSDPKDGAALRAAPTAITFTFNENIGNPAYISVTAPDGSKVKVSGVRAVDNTITGAVASADQKGRYTVAYRVVSADGQEERQDHVTSCACHLASSTAPGGARSRRQRRGCPRTGGRCGGG